MLQFDNVSLRRGPRLLFEGASFQIHPGKKTGLTGANGTGKSSLFALVLGSLTSDQGRVTHPADWIIAHVAQETPSSPRAALEYVLDGDTQLRRLQAQLTTAERADDGADIAQLHSEEFALALFDDRHPAVDGRLLEGCRRLHEGSRPQPGARDVDE